MTVIIFRLPFYVDAGVLQEKLERKGVIPKVREPDELEEPSWRETLNFVHRRVKGSWHNIKRGMRIKTTRVPAEGRKRHKHEYFNGDELLLKERADKASEIIDLSKSFVPPSRGMSFGNGVTVFALFPYVFASVVVDPDEKQRALQIIERYIRD